MAGDRRPLADVARSPRRSHVSRGSSAMVVVDKMATTSAAAAPVHSPAMAPCLTREPAAVDRPARRADASPVATGAHSASSTPRVTAAS